LIDGNIFFISPALRFIIMLVFCEHNSIQRVHSHK
jgi:hypothetical protein